jgi:putative transposase
LLRQSFQFKLFRCKRLRHLHHAIDVAAGIWNHAVALKNRYYKLFGKGLPKARLQAHLARLRNTRMPHWKAVGSQSVQAITDRLYLAWEAFFRGDIKRPPTFRKRHKYRSFTLKQAGYKILGHGRLSLLGRYYRFNQSRRITGTIKTVTVRRDAIGDIYVTFSCEGAQQPEQAAKTGLSAGADFGLKDFLTLSSGERIAAPQPFKGALRHLRKAQRLLSRKQKGSKARNKSRLAVARLHRRVANLRADWQWKTARDLVRRFDVVTIEDLSVIGMSKLWGRKVADLGLADFAGRLEHQTRKAGKMLVKYPRFSRSTGVCPLCRAEHKLELRERTFRCCGRLLDRDQAAAIILDEAGRSLGPGAGVRPKEQSVATGVSHRRIPRALAVGVRQVLEFAAPSSRSAGRDGRMDHILPGSRWVKPRADPETLQGSDHCQDVLQICI